MGRFDLLKDVEEAVKQYPSLTKHITEKKVWAKTKMDVRTTVRLEGTLDVKDEDGGILQTFMVKIEYTSEFPYRYPWVTEIGGLIPREEDYHINLHSGTLCIVASPFEILHCANGITTSWFIHNKLIPHLAMQEYRRREGEYPLGEYAHRSKGLIQAYIEICQAKDWDTAKGMITLVLNNNGPGRNDLCVFGCSLKFKHCVHCAIVAKLNTIGSKQLRADLDSIRQGK